MSSISRKPHALNAEKTLAIPRHFIFFDTETNPVETPEGDIRQDFKLGWCVFWQRPHGRHHEKAVWQYLDSIETFWDFVFSKSLPKQRLWIIARNIVFDYTVCKGWHYLHKNGYKLKFFHNNGVSVIVSVTKGNKSIVFLDSMNWFPESLAKTGEHIGIPKMEIDFNTCTMEYLSKYCRNDVVIEFENFKAFIQFLLTNKISKLCYTRASTAMAAYLYKHYHTPIYIHNNKEAIYLERDSYKGGRCECFYIGNLNHDNYYILDVNSLYPYVMANNNYPVKYKKLLHRPSVKDMASYCDSYSVTAHVSIKTDEPVYTIKRDRTIFPIGNFEVTLTTPELKYAIEHNHLKQVYTCVLYEQANIFRSYVDTMYTLRRDFARVNMKQYETLCKYLLNSLYGKFGQKAEQWVKIGDAPNEPDREELIFYVQPRKVMRLRYLLGAVYELKGYTESYNSFPAISAHVTAYGRMHLWSLMQIAGIGHYYYCDTDSLLVDETGYKNLVEHIDDTKLGYLKLENTGNSVEIRGLKDYTFGDKFVIKGIRKTAEHLGNNTYRQEQWPTFKGLFKSTDANIYKVKHVIKHLNRNYTKGVVLDSGDVRPFVLIQI